MTASGSEDIGKENLKKITVQDRIFISLSQLLKQERATVTRREAILM
jgi:hypothetical protein